MAKGFDGLFQMAIDESKKQFGTDFNTDQTSTWYKMAAPFILALAYLEDKFISLKKGRNIYTAQGDELDDNLTNDLIFRIQGAKAKGKAVITGKNGVEILNNSIEVKGTNNLIYTNISEGTISSSGKIELEFECTELGEKGNLPQNNFKSTIKAPYGITDVQNTDISGMSGGLNKETDYEYLQRYLATIRDKDWSLPAIIAAVRKLNGVKSCNGLRNNTNTDGVIPKKSIRIVVDGGDEDEIARTIYLRTHTPYTVGNIEKQIEMVPGQYETVRFDRPKTTSIDYRYTISSPDQEKILELLKEYLNESYVGDFISAEEFRKKKINDAISINIKVMVLEFKKSSDFTFKPYIQLNFDEKGSAGEGSLFD